MAPLWSSSGGGLHESWIDLEVFATTVTSRGALDGAVKEATSQFCTQWSLACMLITMHSVCGTTFDELHLLHMKTSYMWLFVRPQQLTSFLSLEMQYWAEWTPPNTCSSSDHHTVRNVGLQEIQYNHCSACEQLHNFSIWHFGNFDDVLYSTILVLKRWWLPWDDRRIFYCKLNRRAYRNWRVNIIRCRSWMHFTLR